MTSTPTTPTRRLARHAIRIKDRLFYMGGPASAGFAFLTTAGDEGRLTWDHLVEAARKHCPEEVASLVRAAECSRIIEANRFRRQTIATLKTSARVQAIRTGRWPRSMGYCGICYRVAPATAIPGTGRCARCGGE